MPEKFLSATNNRSKSESTSAFAGTGGFAAASYPVARRDGDVDDYHGERVPDPYRWLENTGDPATASWAAAQSRLTQTLLERVPSREEIRSRVTRWWDYPRFGAPFERGGRWFQTRG